MSKNLEDLNFEDLSDDDKTYVRNTGNPDLMRRAGLLEPVSFDLAQVPGSLETHEKTGDGEPTFDLDSKVAEESVGTANDTSQETLQPPPATYVAPDPVPFEGSNAEKSGQETREVQKPAATPTKKASASKSSTS